MSDPNATSGRTTSDQQKGANPWDDVLRDFQSLGQNIARAAQTTLQGEKGADRLQEIRRGVEQMADEVARNIDEAARTTQKDQVKQEVRKAAAEVKDLGDKVYTDTKPYLLGALRSLNEGLQKIISSLEKTESKTETPPKEM